ncbi:hypothetical protein CDEN61S_03125 [Castellaniella denitrificans]
MALAIAIGKIAISMLSAFAVVYFRFPLRMLCFWMIFVTLMLPVEVRIAPTYAVVADLGMLNSYAGLTLPLIASATATFLFRQFFLTVPDELVEAARIDAPGDPETAPAPGHHQPVRHPRPGRGHDARPPHGRHEQGRARADRHARQSLRAPRHRLRGRIHRLAP